MTESTGWSRYRNRVTTPKLPPPPRIAENRSRVRVGVGAHQLAVRGHDVGREQVVDREPVLAHEVADAAAEGKAADADRARVAEADAEPVRRRRDGDLAGRRAGLGPGRL